MDTERTCKTCGATKPITEYYAQSKQRKNGSLIYRTSCKKCVNKKKLDTLKNNPERYEKYKDRVNKWFKDTGYTKRKYWETHALQTLICPVCGKEFTQEDGKQKYCSAICRTRQMSREYYERKTGKKLGLPKPTHKTCRMCRETKPKTEFSKRPKGLICDTCMPAYQAEQHQKHKLYYQRKARERELNLAKIAGSHTQDEWESVKAKQDYKCLCCGRQEPEITLTKDHITPLAKGGTDNIENIQGLCRVCNSKKCTKVIDYRSS